MEDTILTYTMKDLDYIKTNGCDDAWVLNQNRAGSCKYLVCSHSQGAKQRSAFLVGLISRITCVGKNERSEKDRYAIYISDYAIIDIPNVWKGWQNPVHYTSLENLGINLSSLRFEKLEITKKIEETEKIEKTEKDEIRPLTLEQAKQGLAKYFNVKPENIEIVIKG